MMKDKKVTKITLTLSKEDLIEAVKALEVEYASARAITRACQIWDSILLEGTK